MRSAVNPHRANPTALGMAGSAASARRLRLCAAHVIARPPAAAAGAAGVAPPIKVDLRGQIALVTGGVQGIGRAIAEALAANSATVVVADMGAERTATAAAEISATHGVATMGVQCNVTETAEIAALMAEVERRFGKLDVVVGALRCPLCCTH